MTGIKVGIWLSLAAALGAMWLAWRKAPRDVFGFSLSLSLVLLVFFATSKQAFCNYYFLVIGSLCGTIAIARGANARNTCWNLYPTQPRPACGGVIEGPLIFAGKRGPMSRDLKCKAASRFGPLK